MGIQINQRLDRLVPMADASATTAPHQRGQPRKLVMWNDINVIGEESIDNSECFVSSDDAGSVRTFNSLHAAGRYIGPTERTHCKAKVTFHGGTAAK